MGTAEEFDEFYAATRRRLVLQTFALTGDLGAARNAVRDAFIAARQHWGKVSRLQDPQDWVRPRAWSAAQRRHVARVWHRQKGLDDDQRAVLDALHQLSDVQRKALLLTHLAAMSLPAIGREIGVTQTRTEEHLQAATARFAIARDCDSTSIRSQLESLAPAVASASLPRATSIRRNGRRRRRLHGVVGAVVAVAAVVGAGAFVHQSDHSTRPAAAPAVAKPEDPPVTRSRMLAPAALAGLTPRATWQLLSTSDNTEGSGINTLCQRARFADPRGVGTLVRKFRAQGRSPRRLVQTVEVSASPGDGSKAFNTTLGWYAGCATPLVHLVGAYGVTGVGDQAQALAFRTNGRSPRSYVVGIARTGGLTVSTVLQARDGPAADVRRLVGTLGTAVSQVCETNRGGTCTTTPQVSPVLPPPAGTAPGMLAVTDLPDVTGIREPWVGTNPSAALVNPASTTCDKADFAKSGAASPLTRTFLIPQAKLPRRFGVTETYGAFPNRGAARRFVARIEARMNACEKTDLAATVGNRFGQARGYRGSAYSGWRLDTQINKNQEKVGYWMGVVRVGRYVAQVNLAPVTGHDIDQTAFTTLVTRTRDRLFEVAPRR